MDWPVSQSPSKTVKSLWSGCCWFDAMTLAARSVTTFTINVKVQTMIPSRATPGHPER